MDGGLVDIVHELSHFFTHRCAHAGGAGGRGGGQIMMIPDLEEDEEEDITLQVAAAPKSTARRLQSLEQVNAPPTTTRPATSFLCPPLPPTLPPPELLLARPSRHPCPLSRWGVVSLQLDHDIKYTLPSGGGLDLSVLAASLVRLHEPHSLVPENSGLGFG